METETSTETKTLRQHVLTEIKQNQEPSEN